MTKEEVPLPRFGGEAVVTVEATCNANLVDHGMNEYLSLLSEGFG